MHIGFYSHQFINMTVITNSTPTLVDANVPAVVAPATASLGTWGGIDLKLLADSLPAGIFNQLKSDYDQPKLFFGQPKGLLDTIHMPYTKLMDMHLALKKMDWRHNEFKYTSCIEEFKTCKPHVYNMMIKSLAWQWEGDSIASDSIASIFVPMASATELKVGYTRIADNEYVHAMTYSEIVRGSFENPATVLAEILATREAMGRLKTVGKMLERARLASLDWQKNGVLTDDIYEACFLGICAIYFLEAIQFMPSFAVTFGICESKMFEPIGTAVQMIARDEYDNHVPFEKEVVRLMLATPEGAACFRKNRAVIFKAICEILDIELSWVDYLHADGDELAGVTPAKLKQWAIWCAADPFHHFGLMDEARKVYTFPEKLPLGYMKSWLNIEDKQSSPQEQDNNQYMFNTVNTSTVTDKVYDADF